MTADHGWCGRCGWHDEWHYADGRCPVGIRGKGEQVNDINTIRLPGGNIVINPGSGPVADSTLEQATANMRHLLTDVGLEGVGILRNEADDDRGRFGFLVWRRDDCHGIRASTVQMPGIPLSQVRFMKEPGQDVWDFPRLYVDDSSWIWCIAITIIRDTIKDRGEP